MTEITASALIAEARRLCGTPYRHQGRSASGVDCIGLVVLAARNAGVDLFAECGIDDLRNYGRRPEKELFSVVERFCTPTPVAVPGCLVLIQFPGEKFPRHFALVTEADTLIHAEGLTRQQVIEHGYRAHWLRWTQSRWKLPAVTYE